MKILRLHVADFAAIRKADIQLGPGLNVLYGPNDLGKSTLADAIRLALLLPPTSSHIEEYVPWSGGQTPVVELTFQTESQRIWRVRKEFRKGGAATLKESKNGVDFDQVEQGRKVDGTLRDILRWGIPEPGGAGGGKGLPTSFLATALLSTQADVTSVLSESLSDDPSATGKERIAKALQAVSQDPLFLALLRETQARRDQAYTEKGAKKTAKGSVFKEAADRLKDVRDEKERLQKTVEDSEDVEKHLRELTATRNQREHAVASAAERVTILERLAREAAALSAAAEDVRIAREQVDRIRALDRDVETTGRNVDVLAVTVAEAEAALKAAEDHLDDRKAALDAAERAASADGSDSSTRDTVARQALELRRVAADQNGQEARRRIDAALAASKLVDASEIAAREQQNQEAEVEEAHARRDDASVKEEEANEQLRRLDLLERGLEARTAEEEAAAARSRAEQEAALRDRVESETRERDSLTARRAAITIPHLSSLAPMRRLANDLAGARGALNVGLVVTVALQRPVDLRIDKDGTAHEATTPTNPIEFEANAEVDLGIGDVAHVRIRGGRREAQDNVRELEKRWRNEVAPQLAASGVEDLDGLEARLQEAQALEAAVRVKGTELDTLREKLISLGNSAQRLTNASERVASRRAALGGVPLDSLSSDLTALGSDPPAAVRARRQRLTALLDTARAAASKAVTAVTLAEERRRTSHVALEAAVAARDAELARFPEGVTISLSAAQAAAAAASEEQRTIATEIASLERTIADQAARMEAQISGARAAVERARAERDLAETARTSALKEHSAEGGRLETLRQQRASQDLQGAETALRQASERHGALPVPAEPVTDADVATARKAEASSKADLERVVSEIHKRQGALEQVGGAVARERLRDAIEAFELAERHERDVEDEYDAWLLLLQQMKEAEAAQASNLGQVLAPAIAGKFEALTQKRYENVRLTAQLGTEGVVVSGTVRPAERVSVGTREQLSTLYRLSLAEYLGTTVVLDDQLVQSDLERMDWLRKLLVEKARVFQIVVFTCRPTDYLPSSAFPKAKADYRDTHDGFVRAINLARTVDRR